jgi:hypothetical protein
LQRRYDLNGYRQGCLLRTRRSRHEGDSGSKEGKLDGLERFQDRDSTHGSGDNHATCDVRKQVSSSDEVSSSRGEDGPGHEDGKCKRQRLHRRSRGL